jgi:hypothetical protein
MPILTNSSGSATAPALTANGIGGTFTVTASVNALECDIHSDESGLYLGRLLGDRRECRRQRQRAAVGQRAWTASSNASWLQLSAGSTSGTGNALIQFSYSANPNATAQTGTLTISGLTFTVTQAGASFTRSERGDRAGVIGLGAPAGRGGGWVGQCLYRRHADNAIKKWSAQHPAGELRWSPPG